MFSTAANHFGDIPNTNISENCTGMPGALPVVNQEAVKKAILFGLAIDAKIANYSCFDRKSYFYPDTPRNYQITQFDHPIVIGGTITADVEGKTKKFEIDHAHLEDDAGMLKHFSSFAGIDYNRAGVPLLEIVSKPIIHSPKEAVAYVMAIKAIMEYINASNCNMDEGSLRVDANISVRPKSEKKLRNKTEIKNMNSFTFLEMAIRSEIERQISLYTKHPHEDPNSLIIPGTYRWDGKSKEITLMRRKEGHADYRYFPEPDLLPLRISNEYIQSIKETMPELPHERYKRYLQELTLSEYSASLLVNNKSLSDYFEKCLQSYQKNPHALCNWITIEFMGRLKDRGESLVSIGMPPEHIAQLIELIDKKEITGKIAKQIADEMIKNPKKAPKEIVKSNPNYQPLSDTREIEVFVDQVIKENPQSIVDYKNGKDKAFAYLVGQVMKLSRGKANPQIVNDLLHKKID
jgi:aspartyl-tRNA(Asn)/glutamyl-tRNA(Gln) amidotransferase subunit B